MQRIGFPTDMKTTEIKIEGLFSYLSQIENSRISITWRYELLKHFISKSTRICNRKIITTFYKTDSEGNYSRKNASKNLHSLKLA